MTTWAAITSMDIKYYEKCGKAMLNSWKHNWSGHIPMHVYNENNFGIKVSGVQTLGWSLGGEYNKFQLRSDNGRERTFAKKGFSIIHAMEHLPCDRLIWVDADVIIQRPMHQQLLDLISPDDTLSTHFSVWHEWPTESNPTRMAHSCETGFFIINKRHPGFKDFYQTYKNIYINYEKEGMRRFYDGEVYGKTVDRMTQLGHKMINLSPGVGVKTPISRSILDPYIVHYKAGLKERVDLKDET